MSNEPTQEAVEEEKAPKVIKWKKTNGEDFETNDTEATIEYCQSLGFTSSDKRVPKVEKKDASDK